MARRRPARRAGRRSGDGIMWALVGLVVAVPLINATVGFVRASGPWLLVATLTAGVAVAAVALLLARRSHRQRDHYLRANARLETIDQMSGEQFEHLVAALLRRDGFRKVRVTGGAGDGGVDVLAVAPDGRLFAVQCKRWSNNVGSPHVRNLLGALAHAYAGHTGLLVTSSGFTSAALREGRAAELPMIARAQLAEWALGCPLPDLLAPSPPHRLSA
ncbi:restriction endonuclease [Sphaerisporangium krabiense]|uniref:Restriction system protein n=1 Tax=Sphaerisporangium krabiense TaxID=763782 RepID=A0A7W9DR92_9ACTN|nr:restriction endonuclease [Sphaerisporangium krabiense]MBB5628296.1 restriction system protein [Sphaerisporangium krabiense]